MFALTSLDLECRTVYNGQKQVRDLELGPLFSLFFVFVAAGELLFLLPPVLGYHICQQICFRNNACFPLYGKRAK